MYIKWGDEEGEMVLDESWAYEEEEDQRRRERQKKRDVIVVLLKHIVLPLQMKIYIHIHHVQHN